MDFLVLLGIAFGLSMDAFSVSVATGCVTEKNIHSSAIRMALWFGIFQAIMPIAGYFLGIKFKIFLENIDHWVASFLLFYVSGKMLFDSIFKKDNKKECNIDTPRLLLLAVATSIDAFAIGISLSLIDKFQILPSAIFIGFTTFLFCLAGFYAGRKIGHFLEKKAEFVGAMILILIGIKILFEHIA